MFSCTLFSTKPVLRSIPLALGRRSASTCPLTIKPSQQELSNGRLAPRNLEKAVRSLHEDGLVVIEDAIPHKDLDHLNAKMVKDALHLQSRGKDMPFNYNVGNSRHQPLSPNGKPTNKILTTPSSQSNKTLHQPNSFSPPPSSSTPSPHT